MLTVVTPSTDLPHDLDEMLNYLRIDDDTDEELVRSFIKTAAGQIEDFIGRQLLPTTLRYSADEWPIICGINGPDFIRLPRPPFRSMTSVQYVDANGTLQTWGVENYTVDSSGLFARLSPVWGTSWPSIRCGLSAVRITYSAGYADAASIPEQIRSAIKVIVAYANENREAPTESLLSPCVQSVLAGLRIVEVAG